MNIPIKMALAIAVPWGSQYLLGQEQHRQKISFHVTAVRQSEAEDYCTAPSPNCSATRFTVEAYWNVTSGSRNQYVLECVEVIANGPPVQRTMGCVRLHANNEYAAELWDESIHFPTSEKGFIANYKIKSEKEGAK